MGVATRASFPRLMKPGVRIVRRKKCKTKKCKRRRK